MKKLFVLTAFLALIPVSVNAESCYAVIGGKRMSLGQMCGDTPAPARTGNIQTFLRELRKALSRDAIAVRMLDKDPQDAIEQGKSYCESRKRISAESLTRMREALFEQEKTSNTTKLLMRSIDRLAEKHLCPGGKGTAL